MKKVLLLGCTGMLGSAVYNVLKDKYQLVLVARDASLVHSLREIYGHSDQKVVGMDFSMLLEGYKSRSDLYLQRFIEEVGDVDYVINAVGVTIPFSMKDPAVTFFVNGSLPHVLAGVYAQKLIHITTDCVYNGKSGYPYDELDPKTPVDLYGLSKSLGEPTRCLTIRTSIIGRELHGHTGLLDWFLQQKGKSLSGFTDHFWNGITTHQFGLICDQLMSSGYKPGLSHVFSTVVSKYDMLLAFREHFNIDCEIKPASGNPIDRTLATVHTLNSHLNVPSFHEMIKQIPCLHTSSS